MIIDTSALLAILQGEVEAEKFIAAIEADPVRKISTVSVLEAAMVLERRFGPSARLDIELFLEKAQVEIVPFTAEHMRWACAGFQKYGKGFHPAGLNFGDCAVYGLAIVSGEPVLFKGEDFGKTDLDRA